MAESNSDNKRLAKNSLFLYGRTFLTMIIGFYSSRVILEALGVDDFGLYNIVGGFVAMFYLVTDSLVTTTQRYITVEIGKKENGDVNKVFGAVVYIHILLAVVFVLLLETIGLWFLNNKLNIPLNSYYAANWTFQFSVLTNVIGIFSTPYLGVIVAHERMKAFAYIGLFGSITKLAICFCVMYYGGDKLIFYALLLTLFNILNQVILVRYCVKNFNVKFRIIRDKSIVQSMFNFAGVNFVGSLAWTMSGQGVSVVLNLFFGVAVNAARGITTQVQQVVSRFVTDFTTALSPQITKEYAAGELEHSLKLCYKGAKLSFLLMLVPMVPIFVRVDSILRIWLGNYPEYTAEFISVSLFISLFNTLGNLFQNMIYASGEIKAFTWWSSSIRLLVLPLVYLAFYHTNNPVWAYTVVLFTDLSIIFIRIILLERISGLNIMRQFLTHVVFRVLIVLILSIGTALLVNNLFPINIWGLILFGLTTTVTTIILSMLIGLTRDETHFVYSTVAKKFHFRTQH